MALRLTMGFAASQLQLVGLDWAVPELSTLSRRQKTFPLPGFQGTAGPLGR
jgi:hypothetical protein